jgi:hypothetical protein
VLGATLTKFVSAATTYGYGSYGYGYGYGYGKVGRAKTEILMIPQGDES